MRYWEQASKLYSVRSMVDIAPQKKINYHWKFERRVKTLGEETSGAIIIYVDVSTLYLLVEDSVDKQNDVR